jgi:hypothetical protein
LKNNKPATIDGATLTVLPTPPTIHLKTLDQVRLEMSKVYRDSRQGRLDVSEGAKLVFMLSQVGKMIELSEIENRITALEASNGQT